MPSNRSNAGYVSRRFSVWLCRQFSQWVQSSHQRHWVRANIAAAFVPNADEPRPNPSSDRFALPSWLRVGKTTLALLILANSSTKATGASPKPAHCIHWLKLFHNTYAKKQIRIWPFGNGEKKDPWGKQGPLLVCIKLLFSFFYLSVSRVSLLTIVLGVVRSVIESAISFPLRQR
jgi:hypothetical protein